MNPPPKELDGARLLYFAEVSDAVRPTGKTTHRVDGKVFGPASGLAICQYAGDSQFYLFYCDADWTVITDTCHMSLDDTRHQAEFEYEGISRYWIHAANHALQRRECRGGHRCVPCAGSLSLGR